MKQLDDAYTLPCLVFVYGTLKSGHGNNYILSATSDFLGVDYTTEDHIMVGAGIPFVRPCRETDRPDCVGRVAGELWRVNDEETMRRLDMLEGHPNAYTRTQTVLNSGQIAWVYYYHHHASPALCLQTVQPNEEGVIEYAR